MRACTRAEGRRGGRRLLGKTLGIEPPSPAFRRLLSAQQTAEVIELIKNPPAGEGDFPDGSAHLPRAAGRR